MQNFAFLPDSDGQLEQPELKKKSLQELPKTHTIDEALALTGVGIYHYFLQIICGICLMSGVVEVMGVSIIMPYINHSIPSTITEKGLLASSGFIGSVVSSHAVGFLSDTCGRAKILRITLAIGLVTSIVAAFSVNVWMLFAFRFLTGLVISSQQGSVFNFLGEFHSNKTRAKFVTMMSMFIQLGMIFMPALGIAILPLEVTSTVFGMKFETWRILLLVNSSLRLIALAGFLVLPETPRFLITQGHNDEALVILKKMFSKNLRKPEYDYPVESISNEVLGNQLSTISGIRDILSLMWKQTATIFEKSRILRTGSISLVMFMVSMIGHGTIMWLPTIIAQMLMRPSDYQTTCDMIEDMQSKPINSTAIEDDPDEEVSIDPRVFIVLIIIGAVLTVLYFVVPYIIDIVGRRKLMFIWIIISGCSYLAIEWVTDFIWIMVLFTLATNITNCIGITSTIALNFFPGNVSAMGMCLVMMIARIGSVVGSNVFGALIYRDCNIMAYIYFALCIFIAASLLALPGDKEDNATG